MTPDQWRQVETLFEAALERAPHDRVAFLDQACAGDAEVRQKVQELLTADERAEGFMDSPAVNADAVMHIVAEAGPIEGRRIGPYKLIREIGQGGMGVVYLAERDDQEYHKRVAIKLVRSGLNKEVILRRFHYERQILAGLDHPHIARLLDGGTTEDGWPYFVMEYVEGEPIDRYCEDRARSTPERLKLFRTVCSAVSYAHQNLVVHRDLKPSNILVTVDGAPKLLDFGIAKLLVPSPALQETATATAFRPMTPEYASPEQIQGEPITTASDVYSLGVVLYELLTGQWPYRPKSRQPHEIARAICEQEPEKPSRRVDPRLKTQDSRPDMGATPRRWISGLQSWGPKPKSWVLGLGSWVSSDLDSITLMALRKEPSRRYASVEQFSQDIERYMEGRPVLARKGTLAYRARKFAARHKTAVAAAVLIVATLIGGIVTTTRQARIAQARFNDVRALANSLIFQLHDEIAHLPGSTRAREQLVKMALAYLDRLAQSAGDDPALQRELATAYERVGDVQGNQRMDNLGDTAGALRSHRRALVLREALAARDLTSAAARRELANSLERIGDLLWETGRLTEAAQHFERARVIRERVSAEDPGGVVARRELAKLYQWIGEIQGNPHFSNLGDTASALKSHRRAQAILEDVVAQDPAQTEAQSELASGRQSIGDILLTIGDTTGALESYRQALAASEALSAKGPLNAVFRRNVAASLNRMGDALMAAGQPASALDNYRRALVMAEALATADATSARARRDLSVAHNKLGDAFLRTGDQAGALRHYQQALAIREALAAANPDDAEARRDVNVSCNKVGDALAKAGHVEPALAVFRKGMKIAEALAADPANAQARRDLLFGHENIGDMLAKTGNLTGALQSYRQEVDIAEALAAADPASADARFDQALARSKMGEAHAALAGSAPVSQRTEHWRQARSWYQRSLDVFDDMRRRGILSAADAGEPDRIARELARCDSALGKLKR